MTSLFALLADFGRAVLEDRNDLEAIPGRLGASGRDADALLARQAERGMRLIARDVIPLRAPDLRTIDRTRDQVRAIHARAYDWDPPLPTTDERLSTTSMRQYVRAWINEWDLKRLYPGETVETVVAEVALDYDEDADLEVPSEGEDGPAW